MGLGDERIELADVPRGERHPHAAAAQLAASDAERPLPAPTMSASSERIALYGTQ